MKKLIIAVLIMASAQIGLCAESAVDEPQLAEIPTISYSRAVVRKACIDGMMFLLIDGWGVVQVLAEGEDGDIYQVGCE